jgi:FG-GAP-like repeat
MNARTIKYAFFLIFILTVAATAQILKPKEIIYSRLPNNVNQPPTGLNQPTIWAVGQDGSNDRFITYGTKPRISDDGRFLLFNRFTNNPASYDPFGGYGDFVVRDLSTGQETVIISLSFNTTISGLSFSPESNQGEYEIIADNSSFMYKFNRDGTNIFRFPWENSDYIYDDFPAVRRGGDQLIAFSNNSPTTNIGGLYTVGITGLPRQKIPNTTCKDFHPAWSNDNQFIAFGTVYTNCSPNFPNISYYPYWISNLFKIKPDGTGRQQISNFPANPDCSLNTANCLTFGYVWTEDNSKIIAAGRINGTKGLFAFNADGSGAFSQIPISNGNAPEFVGGIVQPRVERNVLSIGGGIAASTQYTLVSTIGEPIAGQTSTGGTFNLASGFWAIPAQSRKTPFDFDGDGKTDVSVFRPSNGVWYLNRSTAGFNAVQFGLGTDLLTPADFDGDGKTDLAVFRSGNWYILQSSNNAFAAVGFGTAGDIPRPGDFDGDGRADICVFRPSNGVWYRLNSSNNSFVAVSFGQNGDKPLLADFDGDARADITVFRPSNGAWYWLNSSNGSFAAVAFGVSTDVPQPGDFDGDGRTDVSVYRPSAGSWYRLNSTNGQFAAIAFGTSEDQPSASDYDGDGRTDQAVFRPSVASWFLLQSSSGFSGQQFGIGSDFPVPTAFSR